MHKKIRKYLAVLMLPMLLLNMPLYVQAEEEAFFFAETQSLMEEETEDLFTDEEMETEEAAEEAVEEVPEESDTAVETQVSEKKDAELRFVNEAQKLYVSAENFVPEVSCVSDAAVRFSSSDMQVAEITEAGEVQINGAGSVVLKAVCDETEEYASGEASCVLTVLPLNLPEPVFENAAVYKKADAEPFLNPLTLTYDGTPVYESSDESVASVDENGLVRVLGEGQCVIRVTGSETKTCSGFEASYVLVVDEDGLKDLQVKAEDVSMIYDHRVSAADLITLIEAPDGAVVYYSLEGPLTEENRTQAMTAAPVFDRIGEYTIHYYADAPEHTPAVGSVKLTLLVHDISEIEPVLAYTTSPYSGKEKHPIVTMPEGMKRGRDYTVVYTNNVEVGRATVTVEGIGNYKGRTRAYFKIVKKNQPILGVDNLYTRTYTSGLSISLKARTKAGGKIVYTSNDPSVASVNRLTGEVQIRKPGKAQITIEAMPIDHYGKNVKTVKLRILPEKPQISQIASNYEGIVSIGLAQPAGGDGYVVQFSRYADFSYTVSIGETKLPTLVASKFGLTSGAGYYVRARLFANTAEGRLWSDWSDTVQITVK